jgi:hypothetical protein
MARTRWPSDLGTPRLLPRPGRSDRQRRWVPKKNLGPAGRSFPKTTSGVSRLAGQAGPRPPTLRPDQSKTRRQGRSTIHILPADYALDDCQRWRCQTRVISASSGTCRGGRQCYGFRVSAAQTRGPVAEPPRRRNLQVRGNDADPVGSGCCAGRQPVCRAPAGPAGPALCERGESVSHRRGAWGASKPRARARSTASVRLWVPSLA